MAITSPKDQVNLHLSCHCGTFNSIFMLSKSSFPLKSSICHCSLCRHASGHIFSTFAVIPLPNKPDCEGLTSFNTTKDYTRWFCSTCACSIWNDDRASGEWEIATGIISGVTSGTCGPDPSAHNRGPGSPEGVMDGWEGFDHLLNRVQVWIGATGDGGGAIWINGGKQDETQRFLEGRNSEIVDDGALRRMVETATLKTTHSASDAKLSLVCACKGIHLHISRPDATMKYAAGLDACWSCRKVNGVEITSWATVPWKHVRWADGKEVTLKEDVFGIYPTSDWGMRYFCKGCGVPVFWHCQGRDSLDIGVGLVENDTAGEGVRVEGWFDWIKYGDRYVGWMEDTYGDGFVTGLVEGVKRDQGVL